MNISSYAVLFPSFFAPLVITRLRPLSAAFLVVIVLLLLPTLSIGSPSPVMDTTDARADSLEWIDSVTDGDDITMPHVRRNALTRDNGVWEEALRIHYNAIVLDGHIDTPTLMLDEGYDFGEYHRGRRSHVDLPRMKRGGLDGGFFAIYVGPGYAEGPEATERARAMMDALSRQVQAYDDAEFARSADDVRRIAKDGRRAILMGLEGGHALAGSVDTLRAFYEDGIRYVTLTHVNTNSWADASQSLPRHGGLNEKGHQMVREMNRLGMLVDLSHVSDDTFYDAIKTSTAPVILSHSSARALSYNVRNISDDMLRTLADNGGVIMINFFDAVVNQHLDEAFMDEVRRRMNERGESMRNLWPVVYELRRERNIPSATIEDVLDHIDHVVEVAGIEHVGLGSDFDGVFDLPSDLYDVTRLPWITHGLLERGYSEHDIYKILGGNTLRVLEDAQAVGQQLRGLIPPRDFRRSTYISVTSNETHPPPFTVQVPSTTIQD